uniref:Uncharacterized protein n=1 Tax=viral metagenome TaxID=1070528 RepID=A0A2V0RB39_9ZZZZ
MSEMTSHEAIHYHSKGLLQVSRFAPGKLLFESDQRSTLPTVKFDDTCITELSTCTFLPQDVVRINSEYTIKIWGSEMYDYQLWLEYKTNEIAHISVKIGMSSEHPSFLVDATPEKEFSQIEPAKAPSSVSSEKSDISSVSASKTKKKISKNAGLVSLCERLNTTYKEIFHDEIDYSSQITVSRSGGVSFSVKGDIRQMVIEAIYGRTISFTKRPKPPFTPVTIDFDLSTTGVGFRPTEDDVYDMAAARLVHVWSTLQAHAPRPTPENN